MAVADKITSIKQHVTNAYTAIQGKGGTIPTNKNIENLETAITSISTSTPSQEKTKTITENGTSTVTPDNGYLLSKVEITTNVQPALQEKTVTPTKQSQSVTPDSSYDGLSAVTVQPIPSNYIIPSGIQNITSNGTHDVTTKATVNVNVAFSTQEKTVTPSASVQNITPDSGKDGLSKVTVNAVPSETKTATPTKAAQTITPTSGKWLSSVTVNAIPSSYVDTGDATAAQGDILAGATAYVGGVMITGTIEYYNGNYTVLSGASTQEMDVRAVEPPLIVQTVQADTNTNGIIEIDNPDEMAALLTEDNIGKVYKYVGESNGTFENGEIYVVEA